MIFILPILIFIRLFMWRLFPHFGTGFVCDTLYALICILFLTFYSIWTSRSRFTWPMLFILLSAAVSTFFYAFTIRSMFSLLSLCALMLLFTFIVRRVRDKETIHVLWGFMFLGALISAMIAIREFFLLRYFPRPENLPHVADIIYDTQRACSLQGWPTMLAGYLILFIPTAYFRLLKSRRKILYGLILPILLFGLGASVSVVAIASLCAALFIFGDFKKAKNLLIITGILVFLLSSTKTFSGFFDTRYTYVKTAIDMIVSHPFIGHGFGSFQATEYSPAGFIVNNSFFAHNAYLQVWAEHGILAFIGYLGMFGVFWSMKPSKKDIFECSLYIGLLTMFIDNVFSFTMIKPNISFMWWVALALYSRYHYLNRR